MILWTPTEVFGIKTGAEDSGIAFLGASKVEHYALHLRAWLRLHEVVFDDTAILMNWAINYNRVSIQRTDQIVQIRTSGVNFLLSAVAKPSNF